MGLFSKASRAKSADQGQTPDQDQTEQSATPAGGDGSGLNQLGIPKDYTQISAAQMSEYIDFGALLIPKLPNVALQPVDAMSENSFRALTVQTGSAAVEIMLVAAMKSRGLWDELRDEIRAEVTKQGNTCEEISGTYGTELLVQFATQTPEGKRGYIQLRYAGVDGPNWFLRLVFSGFSQPDDADLRSLEKVLQQFVVVRGEEPMTPKSIIPVVLPAELLRQLQELSAAQ